MGFSWAVFAATSLGWFFMLHRNPVMPHKLGHLEAPPLYMKTKNNDGVVMCFVDNCCGYFLALEVAETYLLGLCQNMAWYRVQHKYIWIDTVEYGYTYDEKSTDEQTCRDSVKVYKTGRTRGNADTSRGGSTVQVPEIARPSS